MKFEIGRLMYMYHRIRSGFTCRYVLLAFSLYQNEPYQNFDNEVRFPCTIIHMQITLLKSEKDQG